MDEKGWGIYEFDGTDTIVVEPIDDIRPHDSLSLDCPCQPELTHVNGRSILIHMAFDFRHVSEWLNSEDNIHDSND